MSIRCPRKYCGALMDARTDGHGVVTFVCEPCERNRRGFCRDCPSRTSGHPNALRCRSCATKRNQSVQQRRGREWYGLNRETICERRRARYQHEPSVRARIAARGRVIREKTRRDDLWRFVHRERMRRWRETPAGRRSTNQSQRKYNAKHHAEHVA